MIHPKKHRQVATDCSPEQFVADGLRRRFADQDCVVVAVGGPGGTGKSSFCKRVKALLEDDCEVLTLDDYKTSRASRKRQRIFGAHPDANRNHLILEHLRCIRGGKSFEAPVYDNSTGRATRTRDFVPKRFNILDGEISTYSTFARLVDLSVFIDSHWETQLATRMTRDIHQRGYTRGKAIDTFVHSNLHEFGKYGADGRKHADIQLFCLPDYSLVIEGVAEDLYKSGF